ncbi:hypothetical protein DCAR_0519966 [Daucus carota subsp. sativus]|uniref:Uncharacterized protein n=1 Tax=Daucus carota subsp. sativus TaxID=79200 RepID=A0A175YC43_DAUCS|nr:hypothetical protein DCAR_0519966 [Daucus carota subsp. sativus]
MLVRKLGCREVSWTEYNSGRKLLMCATSACSFFRWGEGEMDTRAKSTINGLLRRSKLKDDEHFAELIQVSRCVR